MQSMGFEPSAFRKVFQLLAILYLKNYNGDPPTRFKHCYSFIYEYCCGFLNIDDLSFVKLIVFSDNKYLQIARSIQNIFID
jgi:hypothetical protein